MTVEIAYSPRNRFFDGLVGFLAAAASVRMAAARLVDPEAPAPALRMACRDANGGSRWLSFLPDDIMAPLLRNEWPGEIRFRDEPAVEAAVDDLGTPAMTRAIESLLQSEFVRFYEAWAASIVIAHGKNITHWPAAWAFGRVVRNAVAHGGNFEIPSTTDVMWRGLRITDADHGRRFSRDDVRLGEFIRLMEDMDDALNHPET